MKPDDLSQRLPTATFSKFCTFQSFKNMKAKRDSDYHSESTCIETPGILKISMRSFAMKFLIKL